MARRLRDLATLAILATPAFVLPGCGAGNIAPVTGQVTLNGAPLAGAAVTFQPIAQGKADEVAIGSYGRTDAEGRFTLRLVNSDRAGAIVGTHVVTLSTAQSNGEADASLARGEKIPASFRNGTERFEVPKGGTDAANFQLNSR